MTWNFSFFINSVLLGFGLAMDAFSVSIVNGIKEPKMPAHRTLGIALVFAFFQAFMPMIGWVCTHQFIQYFVKIQKWLPILSFLLLSFIGGKMVKEAPRANLVELEVQSLTKYEIFIQGIATSIDALSVGFVISSYNFSMALLCSGIIAAVTFPICVFGIWLGKKAGQKLPEKANRFGGILLILIGIEILLKK